MKQVGLMQFVSNQFQDNVDNFYITQLLWDPINFEINIHPIDYEFV